MNAIWENGANADHSLECNAPGLRCATKRIEMLLLSGKKCLFFWFQNSSNRLLFFLVLPIILFRIKCFRGFFREGELLGVGWISTFWTNWMDRWAFSPFLVFPKKKRKERESFYFCWWESLQNLIFNAIKVRIVVFQGIFPVLLHSISVLQTFVVSPG